MASILGYPRLTDAELNQRLLKPREVQELLGIGRTKVYEMLANGELPVIRIGKAPRVRFSDLKRWVDGRISVGLNSKAA